jgi:alkanesulfonate monooxygenase SsuD/methylene tetrahydromethanopterin reductase-like flavin-dependent oxidoreductase (luciferase family)
MGRFEDACASYAGPRPKIMLLHHAFVGRDAADVEQAAGELSAFYNYFGAWFQNKRPVRQGLIEQLSAEEMAANAMMAPDNLARDLTIGTAAQVTDRLKQVEDLGYDEFSFWIDSGMSFERKRASLARFIDDVMPKFQ